MRKISYEFIKSKFEEEGYELLSNHYIGSNALLKCLCPNNHVWEITWSKFKKGRRCKFCNGSAVYFLDIKKSFNDAGYTLLTKENEYKNTKQKLKSICPKGHIYEVSYSNWLVGRRCKICHFESISVDYKKFINVLKINKYTLLEKIPPNFKARTKLLCECANGHRFYTSWSLLSRGHGCKKCAYVKLSEDFSFDYDFVKRSLAIEDYTLLNTKYENSFKKLKVKCPKGHIYYMAFRDWRQGCRCPKCSKNYSKGHEGIVNYLNSLGFIDVLINDRNLISPYELDIIIPSKKIAIEYCGLYWHSELNGKNKNYHLTKLEKCISLGYKLITIFEDEWLQNKLIVKSRLASLLNCSSDNRIFARKCKVQEVTPKLAKDFCNDNHLQGYGSGASIKLGLYTESDLVAIMTFSKPSPAKGSRGVSMGVWELHRYCSKLGTHVIGGASKLLKHFEKEFYCVNLFTYADRRWSVGNLYEALGFSFVESTKPNYWYILNNKRVHRFSMRKTSKDDKDLTEWENRKLQGHDRIWDCGNLKYIKGRY